MLLLSSRAKVHGFRFVFQVIEPNYIRLLISLWISLWCLNIIVDTKRCVSHFGPYRCKYSCFNKSWVLVVRGLIFIFMLEFQFDPIAIWAVWSNWSAPRRMGGRQFSAVIARDLLPILLPKSPGCQRAVTVLLMRLFHLLINILHNFLFCKVRGITVECL